MSTPNLMSVEQLIKGARTLLLDKVRPYRYTDTSLVAALNLAILEMRRVRPDLFLLRYRIDPPQFEAVSGQSLEIEPQFRLAVEYYTAGHALLRDQEDVQDKRATTFLDAAESMLIGRRPSRVSGGTPTPSTVTGGGGAQDQQQG